MSGEEQPWLALVLLSRRHPTLHDPALVKQGDSIRTGTLHVVLQTTASLHTHPLVLSCLAAARIATGAATPDTAMLSTCCVDGLMDCLYVYLFVLAVAVLHAHTRTRAHTQVA